MGFFISHEEFLVLNPPHKQSAWGAVAGWTKDRNLEEPRNNIKVVSRSICVSSVLG
jgi:hypothetical protein